MVNQKDQGPAYLVLEDGRVLEGRAFGARAEVGGLLAFNTECVGYQQLLTDPDTAGQVVVQTFPCIGNYGVNSEDNESAFGTARAVVVREWCEIPSNFRAEGGIDEFLKQRGIAGVCGIDTRALTRSIRDGGELLCRVVYEKPAGSAAIAESMRADLSTDCINSYISDKEYTISADAARAEVTLIDFGCKRSFIQSLTAAGMSVHVVPGRPGLDAAALRGQGVVLSPGPEAPDAFDELLPVLAGLLASKRPVFAAGLGHLLLAKAGGGELAALRHGHRGMNIPVTDKAHGRTAITTQNHRLYVKTPGAGVVTHTNLSDGTCEGIRYENALSVQFIPAYEPGNMNTGAIFREFLAMLGRYMQYAVTQ